MRITVYDVLGWLANGETHDEIIEDFPELTKEDIFACLVMLLIERGLSAMLRHEISV